MSVSSLKKTEPALANQLRVGGFVPLTATDYPGLLSAVIFCQGCPLRCSYCHNPDLQPIESSKLKSWPQILAFLNNRKDLLEAVVFSGGEPCMQSELPDCIKQVKDLGYKVGLHTSGVYPKMLQSIIKDLDWVGLDIKAKLENYTKIARTTFNPLKILNSLELLLKSNLSLECRMTVHSALTDEREILEVAKFLLEKGVNNFALQSYNKLKVDPLGLNTTHDPECLRSSKIQNISKYFTNFTVRY